MLEVDLPSELLIYKDKIESTIKPFIEIKTKAYLSFNTYPIIKLIAVIILHLIINFTSIIFFKEVSF